MRRNFFSHLGSRVGKNPIFRDPRHFIAERSMHDERVLSVISFLDKAAMEQAQGWGLKAMADGTQYRDSRQPNMIVAQGSITLAATDKLLYPGSVTALPANYFWPGKGIKLTVMGALTTGATPGNVGVEHYYGTTDAGGTLLASSVASAAAINKTSATVILEAYARCRTSGPTGTLISWGRLMGDQGFAVFANTVLPILTPASVPAATTIDTTAAQGFNIQLKRSGSTAETFVTHDLVFEALN